jgi:hypothetical protein
VAALRSRGRFGISLGLARIEALLDELGNPQRLLRGALVGGTNGKGSVVAMARSALQAAGLRIGTMPKPHLVTYRERIAIDGGRSVARSQLRWPPYAGDRARDRTPAARRPRFGALTAAFGTVARSRRPGAGGGGLGGRLTRPTCLTRGGGDHQRAA